MALSLSLDEKLARLRGDLRSGLAFVLRDSDTVWLVAAVESLRAERFDGMRALGTLELVITDWRARVLNTWGSDGNVARISVPKGEGLKWVRSMADPSDDLSNPLKGPFQIVSDGKSVAHNAVLDLCKTARLLPAAVMVRVSAPASSDLQVVTLDEVKEALKESSPLSEVSSAAVPLSVANSRIYVFRPQDGGEEHYAVVIGQPSRDDAVLARLHSACFTGDILGSLKCDCGPQLQGALGQMAKQGSGVLLYMNQEGRGIGLANKMRAYSLQDQGFDTVEANHRLGFEDDERDFKLGAEILRALGYNRVRLLTNNPAKVTMMEAAGVKVQDRVPLVVGHNDVNKAYLETKAKKSGHLL